MRYEDITEEMWDKIEADGIVVLQYTNGAINFVKDYQNTEGSFLHNGDELSHDLKYVVSSGECWTSAWVMVTRPESTEELIMNKQWEVGKTYKVKSVYWAEDYAQKLRFDLIGDSYTFTVVEVLDGDVYSIEGVGLFSDDDCWFLNNEIDFFDEVVSYIQPDTSSTATTNEVEQWLDKYLYVFDNDGSVGSLHFGTDNVYVATDHGDILGSKQVVEFINNRYSQLKSAENEDKLKELQAKKDKLMLELADVKLQIGELEK